MLPMHCDKCNSLPCDCPPRAMIDVKPMSDEGVAQAQRVVDAAYAAGNPSPYDIQTAMLLKRLDAIQSDRDELHVRLLESSKRLLEIKAERDALQAVVDKLTVSKDGKIPIPGVDTVYQIKFGGRDVGYYVDSCVCPMQPHLIAVSYVDRAAAEAALKEQQDA